MSATYIAAARAQTRFEESRGELMLLPGIPTLCRLTDAGKEGHDISRLSDRANKLSQMFHDHELLGDPLVSLNLPLKGKRQLKVFTGVLRAIEEPTVWRGTIYPDVPEVIKTIAANMLIDIQKQAPFPH